METLSNQYIFDKTAEHLFTQGCRATEDAGGCRYRMPDPSDKRTCALGFWIRDSEYTVAMEGCSVMQLKNEGLLPQRFKPFVGVLYDLQQCHDFTGDRYFMSDIGGKLMNTAKKHGLNTSRLCELISQQSLPQQTQPYPSSL